MKDKLNDLEDRSSKNNLRIDQIIEEENEPWLQSEMELQEIIKDQLQLKHDIKTERAHRSGKKRQMELQIKREKLLLGF